MRCFQMQHITHHMKAEKESYSQNKPTRDWYISGWKNTSFVLFFVNFPQGSCTDNLHMVCIVRL